MGVRVGVGVGVEIRVEGPRAMRTRHVLQAHATPPRLQSRDGIRVRVRVTVS